MTTEEEMQKIEDNVNLINIKHHQICSKFWNEKILTKINKTRRQGRVGCNSRHEIYDVAVNNDTIENEYLPIANKETI